MIIYTCNIKKTGFKQYIFEPEQVHTKEINKGEKT